MTNVFSKLESAGISIYEYREDGQLCGYELDTYTAMSVNQIIFVDFRDTNKDPENENDFKELFSKRVSGINIDEEIEVNRQDKTYKQAFTLSQSLRDFKGWKNKLTKLASGL